VNLDIGAGLGKEEGWTSLDINAASAPDLVGDATKLDNIPDESCHQIRAAHLIEHLYHFQVAPALALWFQKLKSGGRLTLHIPDVRTEMERFLLRDEKPDRFFAIVYGKQWSADPAAVHKTAFWPERIEELLSHAGFCDICFINPRWDTEFSLHATKPTPPQPVEAS